MIKHLIPSNAIIAIILLITSSFFIPTISHGQETSPNTVNFPALDIVLIVDESRSMWQETDISKSRLDAFNLLVDNLAAHHHAAQSEVRLSVIAFGSEAKIILPFTPVNSNNLNQIKNSYQDFNQQLENPTDPKKSGMGWTNILAALQIAETLLTNPARGHNINAKPAIIILSDGKPETETMHQDLDDFENLLAGHINQISQQTIHFQSPPGGLFYYNQACQPLKKGWVPIYTIAVRQGASLPPLYQDIWRTLAQQNGGNYYAAPDGLTLESLGKAYFQIWTELVCHETQLQTITLPSVQHYPVTNAYKNILFTILKENTNVDVKIYRPDGSLLVVDDNLAHITRHQSEKDEVWSINRNGIWEGDWKVELNGQGTVYFNFNAYGEFQILTNSGSNFITACEPINIDLQVTNSEGALLTTIVDHLEATITLPNGETSTLANIKAKNNAFKIHYTQTCLPGNYHLAGTFHLNNKNAQNSQLTTETWQDTIEAVLNPYLEIINPDPIDLFYTDRPISLQADIKIGTELYNLTHNQPPTVTVYAYQQNTAIVGPFSLTPNTNLGVARMSGEIPANTLTKGTYTLIFNLQNPSSALTSTKKINIAINGGQVPFTPSATAVPTLQPDALTLSPIQNQQSSFDPLAALVSVLVTLGIGAAIVFWYKSHPSMLPLFITTATGSTHATVGYNWGGKLKQKVAFNTANGPIYLEFSPTITYDTNNIPIKATCITLLNSLETVTDQNRSLSNNAILIGHRWLSNPGDSFTVTEATQIKTNVETYNITTV